jgi:hypothetical protein
LLQLAAERGDLTPDVVRAATDTPTSRRGSSSSRYWITSKPDSGATGVRHGAPSVGILAAYVVVRIWLPRPRRLARRCALCAPWLDPVVALLIAGAADPSERLASVARRRLLALDIRHRTALPVGRTAI